MRWSTMRHLVFKYGAGRGTMRLHIMRIITKFIVKYRWMWQWSLNCTQIVKQGEAVWTLEQASGPPNLTHLNPNRTKKSTILSFSAFDRDKRLQRWIRRTYRLTSSTRRAALLFGFRSSTYDFKKPSSWSRTLKEYAPPSVHLFICFERFVLC